MFDAFHSKIVLHKYKVFSFQYTVTLTDKCCRAHQNLYYVFCIYRSNWII